MEAYEKEIKMVQEKQYSEIKDKRVYDGLESYNRIKSNINHIVSNEIFDWDTGTNAYLRIKTDNGHQYFMLLMDDGWWNMKMNLRGASPAVSKRQKSKSLHCFASRRPC